MAKLIKSRLFRFLSSMEVAITLLISVAIAAVIGTVVQQNQPYIDYTLKFGPFWFDILRWFGIYDIYSQIWFLSILAFLSLSTTACVIRNARPALLEMRQKQALKTQQQIHQLAHKKQLNMSLSNAQFEQAQKALKQQLKLRFRPQNPDSIWHASTGRLQKLGYFFTHLGVVIICIAALADSSILLKVKQWSGDLRHETRNIDIKDIAKTAWLPATNPNFRGTVSIPEGRSANVVFLPWQDGYLVQQLPFYVQLIDFRTEHYPTGQPKSFESDLAIFDRQQKLITTHTISVNKPLTINNITIYQSSFEDGGSKLDLMLHDLTAGNASTFQLSVSTEKSINHLNQPLTLELTDFRLFNIQPLADKPNQFQNQGPSFNYKLRNASNQAVEYTNFMQPVIKEGRWFYLSGMRKSAADEFRYLHVPADENRSINRFIQLVGRLNDIQQTQKTLTNAPFARDYAEFLANDFLSILLKSFVQNGLEPIESYVTTVETPNQDKLRQTLFELLRLSFAEVYMDMLDEQSSPLLPFEPSVEQLDFFEDAFTAVNALSEYQYPLFLSLQDFELIQASGLQMTRSSAKQWVYLGCLMLIVGIFIMFYIPKKSVWILKMPSSLLIATENMKPSLAENELERIADIIKRQPSNHHNQKFDA